MSIYDPELPIGGFLREMPLSGQCTIKGPLRRLFKGLASPLLVMLFPPRKKVLPPSQSDCPPRGLSSAAETTPPPKPAARAPATGDSFVGSPLFFLPPARGQFTSFPQQTLALLRMVARLTFFGVRHYAFLGVDTKRIFQLRHTLYRSFEAHPQVPGQ